MYGVRLAVTGAAARSERVGRIGGTPLIGRELMDWTYWAIEPIVRGLAALGILALVLATMLACFMVSYASAKAEAMQVEAPRGLMRRHERAVYLICGIGLTSLFGDLLHEKFPSLPDHSFVIAGLAMVAVIGNVAAVIRLVRIGRALR